MSTLVPWVPVLVKARTWTGSKVSRGASPGELLGCDMSAFPPHQLPGKSQANKTSQGSAPGSLLPALQDPEEGLASPPSAPASSLPSLAGILPNC